MIADTTSMVRQQEQVFGNFHDHVILRNPAWDPNIPDRHEFGTQVEQRTFDGVVRTSNVYNVQIEFSPRHPPLRVHQ